MEMLNQKQKIIAVLVIAIVIIVIAYYYINSTKDVYTNNNVGSIVEETEENEEQTQTEKKGQIKVHITGSVKSNGVVQIEKGGRINDAIEAAGGLTEDADLTDVNLAYVIEDGQKIYIPSIDDKEENKNTQTNTETQKEQSSSSIGVIRKKDEVTFIASGAGYGVTDETEEKEGTSSKININKATALELVALPGIGEATAAKIVEHRKANGNFKTIEQIKEVQGIGDAKFNVIKELISV